MPNPPVLRSYIPEAADVIRCLACGRWPCHPFPHRDSGWCSVCWYQAKLDRILTDLKTAIDEEKEGTDE